MAGVLFWSVFFGQETVSYVEGLALLHTVFYSPFMVFPLRKRLSAESHRLLEDSFYHVPMDKSHLGAHRAQLI